MYKIVPAERQGRSKGTITKNRCKPSKKRLTTVIFGTPGWVRTSGLSLRRRPLYPTELRGLIQKIFNFTGLQDSNDSIVRRRPLYPTELRGLIQKIFNFTGLQDSNDSIVRSRTLYPTELRTHIYENRPKTDFNYSVVSGHIVVRLLQNRRTRCRKMALLCGFFLAREILDELNHYQDERPVLENLSEPGASAYPDKA